MTPARARPLADLNPEWIPRTKGVREGVGLAFTCPIHKDHQVVFYFRRPLDNGAPQPLTPLVDVEDYESSGCGPDFDDLTLLRGDGTSDALTAGCGAQFWVIGGEVLTRPPRRPR